MERVEIGSVRVFAGVKPDKAQAVKVLEEAAEVFGAWQEWDKYHKQRACFDLPKAQAAAAMKLNILAEIADVMQACANLAASLNVYSLERLIDECEERNERRGRYDAGAQDTDIDRAALLDLADRMD